MCRVDEFEDIGPYDDSDDERDALIKRNQVGDVLVARWTARCRRISSGTNVSWRRAAAGFVARETRVPASASTDDRRLMTICLCMSGRSATPSARFTILCSQAIALYALQALEARLLQVKAFVRLDGTPERSPKRDFGLRTPPSTFAPPPQHAHTQ